MPDWLTLRKEPSLTGWLVVCGARSTIEREIRKTGWIFFLMARKIEKTAFGFNRQKTSEAAMARLVASIKAAGCNSFEIMDIKIKSFLGLFNVSISAHARHVQKGRLGFAK